MSRSAEVYLQDIADACVKIRGYLEGRAFDQFSSDGRTVDAVIHNLEIVGEAVKGIPHALRDQHPVRSLEAARGPSRHPHSRVLRGGSGYCVGHRNELDALG